MNKTEELMATPRCDALDLNTLDSNDIRAWHTLARQLERELNCWTKTPRTEVVPNAEAVRIARESVATEGDNLAPIKEMLCHMGMKKVAELVDEHVLMSREIVRLADASRSPQQEKT